MNTTDSENQKNRARLGQKGRLSSKTRSLCQVLKQPLQHQVQKGQMNWGFELGSNLSFSYEFLLLHYEQVWEQRVSSCPYSTLTTERTDEPRSALRSKLSLSFEFSYALQACMGTKDIPVNCCMYDPNNPSRTSYSECGILATYGRYMMHFAHLACQHPPSHIERRNSCEGPKET